MTAIAHPGNFLLELLLDALLLVESVDVGFDGDDVELGLGLDAVVVLMAVSIEAKICYYYKIFN
jgi:hypothetical protein